MVQWRQRIYVPADISLPPRSLVTFFLTKFRHNRTPAREESTRDVCDMKLVPTHSLSDDKKAMAHMEAALDHK